MIINTLIINNVNFLFGTATAGVRKRYTQLLQRFIIAFESKIYIAGMIVNIKSLSSFKV